jgi:endonuclease YncB( thermonuclease family)
MRIQTGFIFFCLLLCCASEEQSGHVVKVIDGDTFEMKSGNEKIRVRLFGIDSPERGQPFNVKAKEFTASLIAGKDIRVVVVDRDRYGRSVAEAYLMDGTHVNAAIVEAGYAWHFKQYSEDPELARLEAGAHAKRKGLWEEENPVAPWDFRRRRSK